MMNRRTKKINFLGRSFEKGSVLAYELVIMAVMAIILTSLLQYVTSQLRFSFYRGEKERAFQVAESGINFYRWYLAHQISGKSAQQINDFWNSGNPYGVNEPYQGDLLDPEGGVIGRYKIEVQKPQGFSTIAIVKSTGWTLKQPDSKRVIRVRFRRPSWSEYAVVSNDEMNFGPNTEVYGAVHSNKGIRFDGKAHNIISSSLGQYDDPDHEGNNEFGVHTHVDPATGNINNSFQDLEAPPKIVQTRSDVFLAGRQFPVPTVDFNGMIADLNYMKSEAQDASRGVYYGNDECDGKVNEGRHIILSGNVMTVKTVTKYSNADFGIMTEGCVLENVPIPNDGIIFVENDIWLEGTINDRRVTIVSADLMGGPKASIFLGMSDLLYTNHDGRDIIGLMAQFDIEVIKNSLYDLTIDAALMAQSGKVGRGNYTPLGCDSETCQDHKGTITLNGALATDLRYGFTLTNGTGNLALDPMFVDKLNLNYRLQPTSPLIDKGTAVGLPYKGTAPDIGAYEAR